MTDNKEDGMKMFIQETARKAGQIALDYLGKAKVSSKGPKDVVTEADVAVEKFIISEIRGKFPGHNIVAEESTNTYDPKLGTWYIDPIDGTANYCKGDQNFAVSIAYAENGLKHACVYLPMAGELYYAQKGKGSYLNGKKISVSKVNTLSESTVHLGISPLPDRIDDSLEMFKYFSLHGFRARDYGFSAGQLAFVAAGRAEAIIKLSQHPWDIAAGILLIEEAEGKVTDDFGKMIFLGDAKQRINLVGSNGLVHVEVLEKLNGDLKHLDRKRIWW